MESTETGKKSNPEAGFDIGLPTFTGVDEHDLDMATGGSSEIIRIILL